MELASLSSRGKEAQQPPVSYLNEFLQSRADPYHEEDNPDGYINFAVAENKLCSEMVSDQNPRAQCIYFALPLWGMSNTLVTVAASGA